MFRIGDVTIAHADATLTASPDRGPSAGQRFKFSACKSFETDMNVKVVVLEGMSYDPVAIVVGVAAPDFKIGLDVGEQALDYAEFCGAQFAAAHHTFAIVYSTRTPNGKKVKTITLNDCGVEKGWGIKSESGGAPSSEFSGKARQLILQGLQPFPAAGQAGAGIGASLSIGGITLGVAVSL